MTDEDADAEIAATKAAMDHAIALHRSFLARLQKDHPELVDEFRAVMRAQAEVARCLGGVPK